MATDNERILDAALRHQIGLRRLAGGEVARALELLEQANDELQARIMSGLRGLPTGTPATFGLQRFVNLRRDIAELRRTVWSQFNENTRQMLLELARIEHDFERRIFEANVSVQLNYAVASAQQLAAVVRSHPFAGGANAALTLRQWFAGLERSDQTRILYAIQQGVLQQETIDTITKRITDTVLLSRRQAETVVRTAVNHVSNAARESFWQANDDIILALRWTATLDGRTSTICGGRDGAVDRPVEGMRVLDPVGARPPAHPNCRSIMVAILDTEGVANVMGERPFVRDTRTGRRRRREMPDPQQRRDWARENVGRVPADMDYDTWLRRQSDAFQDDVLGPGKAGEFRRGLHLDRFVDRTGQELTLAQLRELPV